MLEARHHEAQFADDVGLGQFQAGILNGPLQKRQHILKLRRRRLLLTRFGSLEKVRAAGVAELTGALGPTLGARVLEQLHTAGLGAGEAPHAPVKKVPDTAGRP